jgi:hypothetical protein
MVILEKPYKEYTKLIVKKPGVLARTESAKLNQLSLPNSLAWVKVFFHFRAFYGEECGTTARS